MRDCTNMPRYLIVRAVVMTCLCNIQPMLPVSSCVRNQTSIGCSMWHVLSAADRAVHAVPRWTDAALPRRLSVRIQDAGWLWSGGFALDTPGDIFVNIRHRSDPHVSMDPLPAY